MTILLFIAACNAPSSSTSPGLLAIGTLEDPISLVPSRVSSGRYAAQGLGYRMDTVTRDGGGEDLVIWSGQVDVYDPGVVDQTVTPGEVVVWQPEATVRLHDGTKLQYGRRAAPPLDLDGDGAYDLVIGSRGHLSFVFGPFEADREGGDQDFDRVTLEEEDSFLLRGKTAMPAAALGGASSDIVLRQPVGLYRPLGGHFQSLPWGEQRRAVSAVEVVDGSVVGGFDETLQSGILLGLRDMDTALDAVQVSLIPNTMSLWPEVLEDDGGDVFLLLLERGVLSVAPAASVGQELSPQTVLAADPLGPLDLGDFDGDGHLDVAAQLVGTRQETPVGIWRGPLLEADRFRAPDVVFGPVEGSLLGFGAMVKAVDLDGDGRDELAVAGEQVWLFDDPLRDWHTQNPGHR